MQYVSIELSSPVLAKHVRMIRPLNALARVDGPIADSQAFSPADERLHHGCLLPSLLF